MHAPLDKAVHPRDVPPDRAVPSAPGCLEELHSVLLARLQPLKEVAEVGAEEQKGFASIILGELTTKWGDFQMQTSDPFLSSRENQEMRRLVAVEIVKRSQSLFMDTIQQAVKTLSKRGKDAELFSVAANMSRLRAQLTWNMSEALSIQRLRYEAVDRVKAMREKKKEHVKTGLKFGSDNDLKELMSISLQPVAKSIIERKKKPKPHLFKNISMYRTYRMSIVEQLPLEESIIERYSTLPASISFSNCPRESGAKHRLYLGSELSDVEVPKFDPSQLVCEPEYTYSRVIHKAQTQPTQITAGDSDELKPTFASEVNLGDDQLESELLNFETSIRALHLQRQLGREGEGEEEELPPLLCGVVTYTKRPKPNLQNEEATLDNNTKETPLPADNKTVLFDTRSAVETAHKFTVHTQMKGSCASTYTPSLSRLSPAIHKQIEPHTPTPTPTRLLTEKHPILGPDPVIKEGTLEQPSTILIELPGKPVLEVTSLRIGDRDPLSTLLLGPCEPVFNPLSGEVPQSIADEMDNKLYVGAELKEVYGELQLMISSQHSDIESYPDIVQAPAASELRLADGYTSNATLHLSKKSRVVNPDLVRAKSHPWGEKGRESWVYSNSYGGQQGGRRSQPSAERMDEDNKAGRQRKYNSWRRWWDSHLTADDCLMWTAQREADFLGVIFHVYESEESQDESDGVEKEAEAALEKKEGTRYTPGYWSVPEGSADSDAIDPLDSLHRKKNVESLIQEKLSEVWNLLETPGISQSEMAIKYGTQTPASKALAALELWTEAAGEISKRESVLRELESFERSASDPLRFFTGPATAQLEESRQREKILKRLKNSTNKIQPILKRLRKEFGDTVTFRGIAYAYKMSRDTVQMLYWLEQERSKVRGNHLQYLWKGHEMPPSLPPLLTSKLK